MQIMRVLSAASNQKKKQMPMANAGHHVPLPCLADSGRLHAHVASSGPADQTHAEGQMDGIAGQGIAGHVLLLSSIRQLTNRLPGAGKSASTAGCAQGKAAASFTDDNPSQDKCRHCHCRRQGGPSSGHNDRGILSLLSVESMSKSGFQSSMALCQLIWKDSG